LWKCFGAASANYGPGKLQEAFYQKGVVAYGQELLNVLLLARKNFESLIQTPQVQGEKTT
jgi:hypothetical protein